MLCPSSEQAPRRKGLCLDTLYPSGLRQFLAHSKRSTGRIDTWILLSEYVQRCLDWCLSNVNDYFGTGEFGVNFSCLYFFSISLYWLNPLKWSLVIFTSKKSLIKKIIPTDMCSVGECIGIGQRISRPGFTSSLATYLAELLDFFKVSFFIFKWEC